MEQAEEAIFLTSALLLFPVSIMIFVAVVSFDQVFTKLDLPYEPINSNAGSRMMYAVKFSAIVIVNEVLLTLFPLFGLVVFDENVPQAFYSAWPALTTVTTIAIARITLQRTHDAGRPRWFALLGTIPIVNLVFFFLRPREYPGRLPYAPQDNRVRLAIGAGALSLMAIVIVATYQVDDLIIETYVEDDFLKQIEQQRAELPQYLDLETVLEEIETNRDRKEIIYYYNITNPKIDAQQMQARFSSSLKPRIVRDACENIMITDMEWTVWFYYRDLAGDTLAEGHVAHYDCSIYSHL